MIAVNGISRGAQFTGIIITVMLAILSGLIVGKILAMFGRRKEAYIDSEEIEVD